MGLAYIVECMLYCQTEGHKQNRAELTAIRAERKFTMKTKLYPFSFSRNEHKIRAYANHLQLSGKTKELEKVNDLIIEMQSGLRNYHVTYISGKSIGFAKEILFWYDHWSYTCNTEGYEAI